MTELLKKGLGSAKRFGTRYGSPLKLRLALVEAEQKQKHQCPYCGRPKVKRLMAGVWQCGKCLTKFTGRAYTPVKRIPTSEQTEQTAEEEHKEETAQ